MNRQQILAYYARLAPAQRWHVALRLALCPFDRLATFVPRQGLIVDLGCGHGTFALALALESPARRIFGVETSPQKLAAAHLALQGQPRIHLLRGDAGHNPIAGPCSAILLIDVLYLLERSVQECLITECYARLAPGGVLLIKTMSQRPRWKAALNWIEECLAVRALRLTASSVRRFAFRPLVEWADLCSRAGFETLVVRLDRGYYHPHGVVVGVRR
jgi:2-polyprenyl-6-hydroxyphenyl methylase/3-demethylubiquinone-9 3-methyltransferase